MDIDLDKLNKLLGVNVDASRNVVQLMELLSKSMQKGSKRIASLSESTDEAAENTNVVAKSTRDWSGVLRALFDPMGAIVKGLALFNFELESANKNNVIFLNTGPAIRKTTEERTQAVIAAAAAYRKEGIAVRDRNEASKRTPAEIAAVEKWEKSEKERIQAVIDNAAAEEDLASRMADLRERNAIKDEENINKITSLNIKTNEEVMLSKIFTQKKIEEVEDLHWQEMSHITVNGLNALTDSYYGLTDVWYAITGQQRDFHETWLSNMTDWVTKIAKLLDDLTTVWKSAATIIAQVAKWMGGDAGGVSAIGNLAGLAAAGGGSAGATVAAGGAAAGGVGFLGKVGGGIKTGAGAIGAGAKAAGSAVLPFLPAAAGLGIAYKAFGPMLETLTGWDLPWTGKKEEQKPMQWEESGFASYEAWYTDKLAKMDKADTIRRENSAAAALAVEASYDAQREAVLRYSSDLNALYALYKQGNEFAEQQIAWLTQTESQYKQVSDSISMVTDSYGRMVTKIGRDVGIKTRINTPLRETTAGSGADMSETNALLSTLVQNTGGGSLDRHLIGQALLDLILPSLRSGGYV